MSQMIGEDEMPDAQAPGVVSTMYSEIMQDYARRIQREYAMKRDPLWSMPMMTAEALLTPDDVDEAPWSPPERPSYASTGRPRYDSGHYSGELLKNPNKIIDRFKRYRASGVIPAHDTIIGTGISGSLAAALVGAATDTLFAVVRRDKEVSHSCNKIEGRVGDRWLFIDDFIASGSTYRRVRDVVDEVVDGAELVGAWTYMHNEFTKVGEK